MAGNATLTATPYANNVQRNHLHGVTQSWQMTTGGTWGTVGDAILLAKIPNKTVITDFLVRGVSPSVSVNFNLILASGSTEKTLNTSVLASDAGFGRRANMISFKFKPYRVSITDTDAIQYGILKVVAAGDEDSSFSCAGCISYQTDESEQ